MNSNCRFSKCTWRGPLDDVFDHCESTHKSCIRELGNENYFEFQLDDLSHEPFLLCGKQGLYWFCLKLDNEEHDQVLKRGIFHIGDSEVLQYTVKLGLLSIDGHVEYWGPFETQDEKADRNDETYKLEYRLTYLEFMSERLNSRSMLIYIGEVDDSSDKYTLDSDEIFWTPKEEDVNKLCVDRFTCGICFEYIRSDPSECENMHFVCRGCFNKMQEMRKLRCPVCRGIYEYDCQNNEKVKRLLKMVKFPSEYN